MKRMIVRAAAAAAFLLTLSSVALAAEPTAPATTIDLTDSFRDSATVDGLQVYQLAGILIIRGRTTDPAQAALLADRAQQLGYARVANLVQTVHESDDSALTRAAERELAIHRALDGCQFTVHSEKGVVTIAGRVRHELQKDVAVQVLRGIDGVRAIETDLQKF
ncbi:MAG: BON domain-containing protein [Acidobacteria bacterium]|nr:BON domain-containing protein [Acidobacteriota bacterium]MBV9478343.1 BON domain-containing protein [Acidobacteriota bacterium]